MSSESVNVSKPLGSSPVQSGRSLSDNLDALSKAAVVAVFAIYVFGFLIVAVHNAEYGFSETNPLRPKIAAAGTLFLLSCLFPVAAAKFTFSHNLQLGPEQRFSRAILGTVSYLVVCTFSAVALAPLYEFRTRPLSPTPRWADLIAVVSVFAVLSAFGAVIGFGWKHYEKHPMTVAACAGAFSMLWVAYFYFYAPKEIIPAVTLWFFGVGIWSELTRHILSDPQKREKFAVHEGVLPVVLALALFPTALYPRIKSSWGGGSSTPVVVYFSRDSRILPGQQLECDLLDESDSGIYIAKTGETPRAIFIPRAAISAMYFFNKPLEPEFLKELTPVQPSQTPQPQPQIANPKKP
jgi:hypothetical protein